LEVSLICIESPLFSTYLVIAESGELVFVSKFAILDEFAANFIGGVEGRCSDCVCKECVKAMLLDSIREDFLGDLLSDGEERSFMVRCLRNWQIFDAEM
jgi:hypothetical protein